MKSLQRSIFKLLVFILLIYNTINAQDWSAIPIPANAGVGNEWVLDDEASDDFNYTFNATTSRTTFGPASNPNKWTNFFHNNFQGPGPTNWEENNISVSGGYLRILNDRDFINGEPVTKTYKDGGYVTRPETQAGCITASKRVIYPVFIEASLQVMNSSIASDIWLLSPDDTEEIDIIESYGGAMSDNRNAFFASRVHLSHHVFIRSPFTDYQPRDWNSWHTQNGVSQWGGRTVRIGLYWKSPTILEYYIDGNLVRIIDNDAIASLLPDGTWEYTYPAGVTSTEKNGELQLISGGLRAGFQEMNTASSLAEAKQLSEISVIDPFNYLENGRRFSKEMDIIINTEDQSWQATANRSPNNTEILNTDDNTMLVDWIRVYKPVSMGDRVRSLTFDNKSNYIPSGDVLPAFSIGEIAEIDVTYATGINSGVEEDLHYIATQIRQLDENGTVVGISDFIAPINGNQANATTTSFQYEIPSTFNDGVTSIPTSADLPTGHKLELFLDMSVNAGSDFENVAEEITLNPPAPIDDRTRFVSFDNKSDYVLAGETLPTFELGQTIDLTVSYATGITNGVEEDLSYVATMLRQLDENGQNFKTSNFNAVILDDAVNKDTVDYQFTIPSTFDDGSVVPTSEDLPDGHKLVLLIFMSVDNDAVLASGSEDIILIPLQPRNRFVTFTNISNYIAPGETVPTLDVGQTLNITVDYATGVSASGVEEDLGYIATMLRELDENGQVVKTSAFNAVVSGDASNRGTASYQFTIPSTYSEGSSVIKTEDLPEGHRIVLLIFMSVDNDAALASGSEDIILAPPAPRDRTISFDNINDYILAGETLPTFELNQNINLTITYGTGVANDVEEDLGYIAVMLRQLDESGQIVNTSNFNVAINNNASNAGTIDYQFTIPSTFADDSLIPTTTDLPEDHQLVLLIFMSVDSDSGFADANTHAIIVEEGVLSIQSNKTKDNNTIVVSPNPFTDVLQIETNTNIPWELYNLQGQKVLSGVSKTVQAGVLPPGLYLLSVDNKSMVKVIKK